MPGRPPARPRSPDRAWAEAAPPAARIDQLLQSLYAFGCERALAVMLLERLHERADAALALLDPATRAARAASR